MLGIVISWFLLCLLLSYKKIMHIKPHMADLLIIFYVLLYSLGTLILKSNNLHQFQINTYLVATIYMTVVYIFVSLLSGFSYEYIVKIFRLYLLILILVVLFQWFFYFLTGDYLDLNKIVSFGTSESRYTSLTFKTLGLIRPTVFFTEPSNASAVISMITFCYMLLIKRLDNYIFLGFLASILTLSTAGVFIGSASLGILLIFYKSSPKFRLFKLLMFILCLLAIYYIISFSYDRINNSSEYDMLATRTTITSVIEGQAWYNHLIGNGINILAKPIVIDDIIIHDYSYRDSGFFINLYYSFGLIGLFLFLFWARINIKNNVHLMIFFVILQSKFDYLQPVFWLLIFTVSMLNNDKANYDWDTTPNGRLPH
uniref:hypothetical protein n=1 Tax=Providencia sp. PROV265 TaxID=2949953 RepID=UPI00234AC497|nr:hypothetical protein [Providencia sp. PROV265]